MRRLLSAKLSVWLLVPLLLLSVAAFAVPAKPGVKRVLTLSDGTTVTATLIGDEYGRFWRGADGKSYQKAAGAAFYQEVNSQVVVNTARQHRAKANQQRMRRLAPRRTSGAFQNKQKGLIILANFSDLSFKSENNNALYQRIANEKNFSEGKFKGSMHDYFLAQSEGQFDLQFDIVGPVTVSKPYSYYGKNNDDGEDTKAAEMVIEALKLANGEVNFADYDWDGDGEVEQVYVVYAGNGEADTGIEDTIWPHEYTLSFAKDLGDGSGSQIFDGVTIDTYACGSELNSYKVVDGIGTMCHEFSHCMGFPDFYDIDYSGGQGMFAWDLMCDGSYNGEGYLPAGYTSYERWVAGWKEPTVLETTQSISNMKALQDEGSDTYVIYNNGNKNEYFLLENRQQKKWDAGIPGSGLLILHVDYDEDLWYSNQPNDDPKHQRMTWIPADNNYQYTTYEGVKYYTVAGAKNDPYPYGSNNAFGRNTKPAAKLYNKNSHGIFYLDSSVENIKQNSNGTVSFQFVAPVLAYYKNADGKKGAELKTALSDIIYNRTKESYDGLLDAFKTSDVRSNGKIWDMYSNTTNYSVGDTGGNSAEGTGYNREHSFPKSWFGGKVNPMYSDLNHIYPTDAYINNMRSNLPFGETANPTKTSKNDFSKVGPCSYPGYTGTVFEPNDEYKGDFARTYFYMVTCYEEKLPDWYKNNTDSRSTLDGKAYPGLQKWQLEMLMKWAKNDPVSEKEVARNKAVYDYQTNRNPFIDYPGLEEYIWGSMTTTAFSYNNYVEPDWTTDPTDPEIVGEAGTYALVTDASTLAAGDKILIAYVNGDDKYALSTTQQTNNRQATSDVTLNADGTLTPGDNAQVITLEKEDGNYLFNVGNGYLYAASSSGNHLKTEATADDNAKATISISSGDATIVFQGTSTRNNLRFNANNGKPLFSCYATTSTVVTLPQIYRELQASAISLSDYSTDNTGEGSMVNGCFNLQGQRVNQPEKGLYIVNGRKVVIK